MPSSTHRDLKNTPCNSRGRGSLAAAHTPPHHHRPDPRTLTCMIASAAAGDPMVFASRRSRFGDHFIRPDCRLSRSPEVRCSPSRRNRLPHGKSRPDSEDGLLWTRAFETAGRARAHHFASAVASTYAAAFAKRVSFSMNLSAASPSSRSPDSKSNAMLVFRSVSFAARNWGSR